MRDNLFRSAEGFELRAAADGQMPTLTGHFARFNEWTEIDSVFEGRFMERVAPGAFQKTIKENRDGMRVLFQHGRDPQVGDKPLGTITDLREDDAGAAYEVRMLDTSYNRDLLPGLQAGLYGASFRMRVTREDINQSPSASDANPMGLPERTIREAQVQEFGPVTFPAYAGATAAVRSITDDVMLARFAAEQPDKLRALLTSGGLVPAAEPEKAPEETDKEPAGEQDKTSDDERAETPVYATSHPWVTKALRERELLLEQGRRA